MARVRVRLPTPQRMPKASATARLRLRSWGKTVAQWAMCLSRKSNRFIKKSSEARLKHRHPNGFAGQVELVKTVYAAASLGLDDALRVGGTIDGGVETFELDEAFQQIELVLVFGPPIRP